MLTRSQALLVNNFFNGTDEVPMTLRNGTTVPKKPERPFTIMRTRSQTHNNLKVNTSYGHDDVPPPPLAPSGKYSVNIDFDGASAEWRKNKRSVGNGCYVYK